MNNNTTRIGISEKLIVCLLLFIFGCYPDKGHFEPSSEIAGRILDQLKQDPELSTFTEALELTGMDEFLNRSGLWTVIAPTNQAFTEAGIDINNMPEFELSQLIGFHVLERMMFTFDFAVSKFSSNVQWRYATRSRKFVTVSSDGNAINGIPFIEGKRDIDARNGAIHVIGQILFPDPSIDDYLEEQEELSIYYQALQYYARYQVDGENSVDRDGDGIIDDTVFLKSYDLVIDLVNESAIKTVYAPNNTSFQAFFNDPEVPYGSIDDFDMSDPVDQYVLTILLDGHAAEGVQPASGTVLTSGQENVTIVPEDVQTGDIAQSNGVIHILNRIIYPPSLKSVAGRALMDKELSKFAHSLIKSTLVNAYSQYDREFTMFAPTNTAFEQAGIDPADQSVTPLFLDPILRYHVVTGSQISADEMMNEVGFFPTSNGAFLQHENTGLIDVRGSIGAITTPDLGAGNGILHKIDNILMPPSKTVAQLIMENNEFSQFRAALTRAGLLSELEQGEMTVFAPGNEAFFELYDYLDAPGGITDISISRLESILKYHMVPNRVFSSDLINETEIGTMLESNHLSAKVLSGNVSLVDGDVDNADALLTNPDSQGTNGVIHKIDAVLLPHEY